jgi:hypothetical protein
MFERLYAFVSPPAEKVHGRVGKNPAPADDLR